MSKRKEINNITDTQAKTIVIRFRAEWWQQNEKTADAKDIRSAARELCRVINKSPRELIATPLQTYKPIKN